MTPRLIIGLLAAASVLAGSPQAQARTRTPAANPSAVIAAEGAFARMAREKGQWTAFRANATSDAVMFVPQMVLAQDWLKDRADPAQPVNWQPHIVWSSCDGTLVVSHGAWQNGASRSGYFTTIWQKQKKKKKNEGDYKWVLEHGDVMAFPLDAPEMVTALVADCPDQSAQRSKPKGEEAKAFFDPARRSGQSDDGTLVWEVTVTPEGARNLSVDWRKNGAMGPALIEAVDAPQGTPRQ